MSIMGIEISGEAAKSYRGQHTDYCLTKGVVLALDVLLIGFKVGHGNSPSLNNSVGRQHSLLSPS